MTPSLDLSDFLIPLIFIGVAIYQVLTRAGRKPEGTGQEPNPFPDDFDPGPTEEERRRGGDPQTWDELMEALGQKPEGRRESPPPIPEPVAPTPPPVVVVPPPLPRRLEVPGSVSSRPDPVVVPRREVPEPAREAGGGFWGGPEDRSAWAQQTIRPMMSARSAFGPPAGLRRPVPAFDAVRLRRALNQPERVREAILLNEVLQKPVALRGQPTGWSG
ncbi:MAG: hypothetical protein SNJ84_10140 [Verrucomicrobiia bacterium]